MGNIDDLGKVILSALSPSVYAADRPLEPTPEEQQKYLDRIFEAQWRFGE